METEAAARSDLLINVTEVAEQQTASSISKPSGGIVVDGRQVADTQCCCHCGAHWVPVKGSGTRRGFCMRCMHATCGQPDCDPCVPIDIRLMLMADPVKGEQELARHLMSQGGLKAL